VGDAGSTTVIRFASLPNRHLNLSHKQLRVKPLANLRRIGGFEEQSQRLDEIDARSLQGVALALDDMVDEQGGRMCMFEAGLS
jgi:hypothetical protein